MQSKSQLLAAKLRGDAHDELGVAKSTITVPLLETLRIRPIVIIHACGAGACPSSSSSAFAMSASDEMPDERATSSKKRKQVKPATMHK